MTKPVRIRSIAEACGLSVAAVSRALKGQPGLKEETRQRVMAVAQEMGYDFSRLRGDKVKRVLFLLHRQHDIARALPFYSLLLLGVEDHCREKGIAMSFLSIGPGDNVEEQIALHHPDALICAGYFESTLIMAVQKTQLPMVLVDLWAPGLPCVNVDNQRGGYLATRHLIDTGRRRIAFLASTATHYSIRQREKGYRQALYESQMIMPPEYEVIASPLVDTSQSLIAAMNELLSLTEPPDAIFAYNDVTAIAAMNICEQRGFRVPQDIAIVGFDDIEPAAWSRPALTTIAVDKHQLGYRAVGLLLEEATAADEMLPVTLVVRGSTGKIRKSTQ